MHQTRFPHVSDSRTASILEDFAATLPYRPYFSETKGFPVIRGREQARQFRYVQPNPPGLTSWFVFDIDYPLGALAWIDGSVPPPTITVSTPPRDGEEELGTAHLFYRLKTPIPTTSASRPGPIRYAAAVQAALTEALNADAGYARLLAKNPLSSAWCVRAIADRPYSLAELANGLDLQIEHRCGINEENAPLGRNCALFEHLRIWAYEAKPRYNSADAFAQAVLEQATALNHPSDPLPFSEVRSTARSVAKWTWTRYTGSGAEGKNRGVLELFRTDLCVTEKQALGARYAAQRRSSTSLERMLIAWHTLSVEGHKPTQEEVARHSGRSLRTVKRHWHELTSTTDRAN